MSHAAQQDDAAQLDEALERSNAAHGSEAKKKGSPTAPFGVHLGSLRPSMDVVTEDEIERKFAPCFRPLLGSAQNFSPASISR